MAGTSTEILRLTLHVWRQSGSDDPGHFESYKVEASPDTVSYTHLTLPTILLV